METDRWIIRRAQPADAEKMKTCVQATYRHYTARIGYVERHRCEEKGYRRVHMRNRIA